MIIYDFILLVLITMFQFMLWTNDEKAKGIYILTLAIKVLIGLIFVKSESSKWIRVYFYIRIGYDLLGIVMILLIMVGINELTLINCIFAMFLLVLGEAVCY